MRLRRVTVESYPSDDSHRVTVCLKNSAYPDPREMFAAKYLQLNRWLSLLLWLP